MTNVIRFPDRQSREPEPLWRELVGDQLRQRRQDRDERIVDVAERAGVSPQYLSEIERGRKDPSSEMLSALTAALDTSVVEIAGRVTRAARITSLTPRRPSGPVCLAA